MKIQKRILAAVLMVLLLLAQTVFVSAATDSVTFQSDLSKGLLYITAIPSVSGETPKEYSLYVNGSKVKTSLSAQFSYEIGSNYSDQTSVYVVVTMDSNKTYQSNIDTLDLSAPSISVSSKQTDHYVKTITATFKSSYGSKTGYTNPVTEITMQPYKNYTTTAGAASTWTANAHDCSMSIDVRPNDVSYVKVTVKDSAGLSREYMYSVGSNGSLDMSSNSTSNGTWSGIVSGSTSSSNSNIYEEYNPDAWTGVVSGTDSSSYSTYYVLCRSLNVRAGAGTGYKKVGKVTRGDAVKVVEFTSKGWAKIKFDGGYAYVSSNYIDR